MSKLKPKNFPKDDCRKIAFSGVLVLNPVALLIALRSRTWFTNQEALLFEPMIWSESEGLYVRTLSTTCDASPAQERQLMNSIHAH